MLSIVLIFVFVVLMVFRTPIAIVTGASTVFVLLFSDYPMEVVPQLLSYGIQKYSLLSVPFFVLAGNLLGMIPWLGAPTGALATTGALALVTFVAVIAAASNSSVL